jgi:hypothetical protein
MPRRPGRIAAVLVLGALAWGAQPASADPASEQPYGMLEAIDPLVGFDSAQPVQDATIADAAANGATVTSEPCAFGDRPGVPAPQILRRPIVTTGHLVVTPSGNITFTCHAAADARSFRPPLPDSAIVVDAVPCFLPGGRRTNDARLVVTPSLHVQLTCHINGGT